MNALKDDVMYIFEMKYGKESRADYKNNSKPEELKTIKYLGSKEQMINIMDRIKDYNRHIPRNKELCEKDYVDYMEKLINGVDISTNFNLDNMHKARVIYEGEILYETELNHVINKRICDLICDSSFSDYDNIQFKAFDYKFKYVKYNDEYGNNHFSRFIYFKFEDLVEHIWEMDRFNKHIDEDIDHLKLIRDGKIDELCKVKPSFAGLSREKIIYHIALDLKLTTEQYRVLTHVGNLGVVNAKYGYSEFFPSPSDAESTVETYVLQEEYSFNNLKELEEDIREPREINLNCIMDNFIDSFYKINRNTRNKE